jgi:hypothetical protein
MADARGYLGSTFSLALDGINCGFVKSASGGTAGADVVSMAPPGGDLPDKRLGPVRYEAIELALDLNLAPAVYDWIQASWNQKFARKNGSIVLADIRFAAVSEQEFSNALLTETTMPALDASSKESAFLTLRIAPESTRTVKSQSKLKPPDKQKQFIASNFRLEIDGLDCTKVSRIDSFTVRTGPTEVDIPNLAITLPESSAASWTSWHEDFVIMGKNRPEDEKNGAIVLLAADRKAELGRVTLHNLGIFALRRSPAAAETVAQLTAGLYCERMDLSVGKH